MALTRAEISQRYRERHGSEAINEYHHRWRLANKYGITVEQYNEMLEAQNGVCAICEEAPPQEPTRKGKSNKLHVDHDHETLRVRGLLCLRCNVVLGAIEDDPELLESMIQYLKN